MSSGVQMRPSLAAYRKNCRPAPMSTPPGNFFWKCEASLIIVVLSNGARYDPSVVTPRIPVGLAMSVDQPTFVDFVRRIRAGDQHAAAELVRAYEPAIRLEVRRRLNDPSLFPVFDSVDICQSVLASFFVRAAVGEYDLDRPEQLLGLLMAMARNKLAHHVRHQHRQRRDSRRSAGNAEELLAECHTGLPPDRLVSGQELLAKVRQGLSAEERELADLRVEGLTWPEVAARLGGEPQARRRQLRRALDRVAQQLGLDEVVNA
jgi:RNA polymerase sigma factor (sigma-70 family)